MLHNNHSHCNPEFVQAACKKFEAEISELKNRLKTQETETRKANAKFEFSVAAQEKLSRPDFWDINSQKNGLCAHQPQDYC